MTTEVNKGLTPTEFREKLRLTIKESAIPKSTILKNTFNAFEEKEILDIFNAVVKGKYKEVIALEFTNIKTASLLLETLGYSELEDMEVVLKSIKKSKKDGEIADTENKLVALTAKLKILKA